MGSPDVDPRNYSDLDKYEEAVQQAAKEEKLVALQRQAAEDDKRRLMEAKIRQEFENTGVPVSYRISPEEVKRRLYEEEQENRNLDMYR